VSATLSASGLARAHACAAAYALPAVHTPPSTHASAGSAVHAYLDAVQTLSREQALAAVPEEHQTWCSAIDLAAIPRGESEVALAYDVRTGRARRLATTERRYDLTSTEIAGTCDLYVPATQSTPARVIDWKTGTWAQRDPEQHRPQLAFYALALARVYALDEVRAEVVSVGDDGRVGVVASWVFDVDALADVAAAVRATWDRVQSARATAPALLDVREGEHCRYCPAWQSCPAKLSGVRAVLDGADLATPEAIGRAYVRAADLERVAEQIRAAAREAAQGGALPTGDGRVVVLDSRGRLALRRAS